VKTHAAHKGNVSPSDRWGRLLAGEDEALRLVKIEGSSLRRLAIDTVTMEGESFQTKNERIFVKAVKQEKGLNPKEWRKGSGQARWVQMVTEKVLGGSLEAVIGGKVILNKSPGGGAAHHLGEDD